MTCEHCRQQLLPFLYDLLEPEERSAFLAHLDGCAECQEALKTAREQQGMLAEAVKESHADIVFKAPAQVAPAPTVLATVPFKQRRSSAFLLNRWAAAAAILFLLFGFGSVISWTIWRGQSETYAQAQQRLDRARQEFEAAEVGLKAKQTDVQKDIRNMQQQIDTLFESWRQEENKTRTKVLEQKGAALNVHGPQNVLPGAPNRYEIEPRAQGQAYFNNNAIQNQTGQNFGQQQDPRMQQNPNQGFKSDPPQLPGVANPMQARVVEQRTNKELYRQKLTPLANGKSNLDLPVDLDIKPGDDVVVNFDVFTPDGKVVTLSDSLKLVFPEFITHLATDRPLYRPGDTVRFRSLTLERFSLKPAQQKFHLRYRITGPGNAEVFNKEFDGQVVGPNNALLKGPDGKELHCLGAGEFGLPADLANGQYTLEVSEVNNRFNEERRNFLVQRWQPARFNKELTFHRSTYGPGDQVKLQVQAAPLQGWQAGNARGNLNMSVRVVVDGHFLNANMLNQPDSEGRAAIEFSLPNQIARGVGTITIECNDGVGTESFSRSIPIVLRDLNVDLYPEGGDLVAGVPNRVYFQARTPAGKPADIEGRIVDDKEQVVARVQTLTDDAEPGINQGLGSFTFTPQAQKAYRLRIDAPIGMERTIMLPLVKDKGVVLHIAQGVAEKDIKLTVNSVDRPRELLIGAYCRGQILDRAIVKAGVKTPTAVTLRPQGNVGGVYRITVFEKVVSPDGFAFRPLAERLIYRKSTDNLTMDIRSDRDRYLPGEPVLLSLLARNEKKQQVPALAMIAVVDANLLKQADEKTARAMPTHFLLTNEVRNPEDLENADVLLGNHPKAAQALDLLLGSQGWRRFAEQDPKTFQQRLQQGRAPVFIANSTVVAQMLNTEQSKLEEVDLGYAIKAIELQKQLAEKEQVEAILVNGDFQGEVVPEVHKTRVLNMAVEQMRNEVSQAERNLLEMRAFVIQFMLGGALLVLLFIGFFLISVGLRRLTEGDGSARPWFVCGLALLGGLFLISVIGTFALKGEVLIDHLNHRNGANVAAMPWAPVPPVGPAAVPEVQQLEIPEPIVPDEDLLENVKQLEVKGGGGGKNGMGPAANPQGNFVPPANPVNPQGNNFVPLWNLNNEVVNPNAAQGQFNEQFNERNWRQQKNYQALLQNNMGRRVQLPPANDPSIVREYAFQRERGKGKDEAVRDFAETVYWHPALIMPDGKAQVQFNLSDAVTRFQVLVHSATFDGRLATSRFEVASQLPFRMEPATPLEVSNRDRITIPVEVTNPTDKDTAAKLMLRGKGVKGDEAERDIALPANQSKRELFHFKPTVNEGEASVRVIGKSEGFTDAVERRLKVMQDGIPVVGWSAGVLEAGSAEQEITLPPNWVEGSLQVQAQFYPSPLAELTAGLDALAREPTGCFEQSASSNYANVMILNYLKQSRQANPSLEKRVRSQLQTGNQKLSQFENAGGKAPGRGFDWFNGTPAPDEALTAYALMQLRDLARVQKIDADEIRRTEQLLLDQRGAGARFGKTSLIQDAYIVWALTESTNPYDLNAEIAALHQHAKASKDPYLLALAGLAQLNAKRTPDGVEILQRLRESQKENGAVTGAATSITGSRGRDLDIETTALAVLGWLKAARPNEFDSNIKGAVRWLGQQRRAGGFGSTQATVLALKALVANAQKAPTILQGGEATLNVRGGQVNFQQPGNAFGAGGPGGAPPFAEVDSPDAKSASFSSRSQDTLTLTLVNPPGLKPGKNLVQVSVTGNNVLPYALTWTYRVNRPANDPQAPLKLSAKLSAAQAMEGDTVKLRAVVENSSKQAQGISLAVLGLPAGLALPNDGQLKALTAAGKIAAWEQRGREVVLYWREFAPGTQAAIDLDLVCRFPGQYRGPASRAYVYYDSERPFWLEPLSFEVTPRQ